MERVRPARLAVAASATVLAILVLAPAANAQSSTDQYSPTLDQAGVIASGNVGAEGGTGGESGAGGEVAAEAGTGKGGKLPFTGYPLTPLVMLAGLLLGAGLIARVGLPALDRRRA